MDVLKKTAEANSRGGSRGRVQDSSWRYPGTLLYASSCTGLQSNGFTSSAPWPGLWIWCCLSEYLIWTGRSPLLLHSMVYGAAHTASVTRGMLSKLTGFCPREAYALEEVRVFELIWIILVWGNEISFNSFSSLRRSLFPRSHFVSLVTAAHPPCGLFPLLGKPTRFPGAAPDFQPGTRAAASCPVPKQGRGPY